MTHLNIILSFRFTFKVSIASNKRNVIKSEQIALLLGEEDTSTTKQLTLLFPLRQVHLPGRKEAFMREEIKSVSKKGP